jgi:hypothetical protein
LSSEQKKKPFDGSALFFAAQSALPMLFAEQATSPWSWTFPHHIYNDTLVSDVWYGQQLEDLECSQFKCHPAGRTRFHLIQEIQKRRSEQYQDTGQLDQNLDSSSAAAILFCISMTR